MIKIHSVNNEIYILKSRIKRGSHKQIKFRLFKHYTIDIFEQDKSKLNFPYYQNFNDINEAYNDFIQKIMNVIDKVAPLKERWVKQNSQEWFDEITNCDKLLMKLKIAINYLKNSKNQNYKLTKVFIMRQDINYRK